MLMVPTVLVPFLIACSLGQDPTPPSTEKATTPPPTPQAPVAKPEERKDEHPEVILHMRDGSVFQGILVTKTETTITLEIVGVPAAFSSADVDRLRELPPVIDRYREMRAGVPEADVEKRIQLIRWLADRRQLEVAVAEAELLLARNPKSLAAKKAVEDLQLELELTTKPADKPNVSTSEPDKSPSASRLAVKDFPLLTAEQINLIKVFELDLSAEPNVIIPRDLVKKLLDEYASNPLIPASREGKDEILKQPAVRTLDLMFRLKARDYYDKVKVIDQPEPMRKFRDDVHRVTVLNGCATSECHGGTEGGRLILSAYRPNADPTLYTNFYILQKFRTKAGDPLINWDQPEKSLLLQLALPRDISRFRHPIVERNGKDIWRPSLSGPDDRRFQAAVDWIKAMYRPRPDYTVEYEPLKPFVAPPPSKKTDKKPTFDPVER